MKTHIRLNHILTIGAVILLLAISLTACAGQSAAVEAPGATPPVRETPTSPPLPSLTQAAITQTAPTAPPATAEVQLAPTGTSAETTGSSAPQCTSPAALTPAATEGPYFTPNSPERASLLEPGLPGTRLVLSGYVLTTGCQPVANAKIDFWQADSNGVYDNVGYTLRGHQFTDANGRYQLETVVPGFYTGRTEHIHVKVQAPNGPELTSQLYFPGVAENETDSIYDPALLIDIQPGSEALQGTFDFIITP